MKILISSKTPQLVRCRTRYFTSSIERYVYLHHNLKIDNWKDFIEYVKKYNTNENKLNYLSNDKLRFFIESYIRTALYDLNTAQLEGKFKEEYFYTGQVFALEKLSKLLNLNIDIDNLKL